MKEKEKRNTDIGKVLMKKLQIEGRQNEVDKYKLHVEEVDKITSLILGLSSRLAKSENSLINLPKNWNEDEEVGIKTTIVNLLLIIHELFIPVIIEKEERKTR